MDKNQIIGISLIALIVIGFSIYNRPSQEEIEAENRRLDSIARVESKEQAVLKAANADSLKEAKATKPQEAIEQAALYSLENDLMRVQVSSKGGRVAYVELKEYQRHDSTDLILATPEHTYVSFESTDGVSTADADFVVVEQSEQALTLKTTAKGKTIIHSYKLEPESFKLNFQTRWEGGTPEKLVWNQKLLPQERLAENERTKTSIHFKSMGEEPDYVSERKNEDEEELGEDGRVHWISYKQHFFNQTLVYDAGFEKANLWQNYLEEDGDAYLKDLHASLRLPSKAQHDFTYIFAPNHYKTLRKFDISLERVIYLGWGIFGWVNRFLVIPVFNILSSFIGNYGIIIAILTVIFKVILLFFTYKAFLSGAKMRALKPELDELKKKHEGDAQGMQAEQMKLYQATGVSPFGGCLPLLVQMPILLALFNFFPNSFELRQESFLWADDLSTYDSILDFGFNIPLYGDHVSLFALLMTISTFIYTFINQSYQPQQQKELKYLPYFMPLIFLSFLNSYSAALSYYYFLANLISIGQTFLFKVFVDEDKLREQIEENKKKRSGKASGGMGGKMQGWLEKQQKKQQAMQQQRGGKKKK